MNKRILHCSTSLENYYLCLEHRVAGFGNRGPKPGDRVYLAVKVEKKSLCGARFMLDEPTDLKPWVDADNYVNALSITQVEYCKPFDIFLLSLYGGKYWGTKYLKGSKVIPDVTAIEALNTTFLQNKIVDLFRFEEDGVSGIVSEDNNLIEDEKELVEIQREIPNAKISIIEFALMVL